MAQRDFFSVSPWCETAVKKIARRFARGQRILATMRGWLGLGPGPAKMWALPSDVTAVRDARRYVASVCSGMPTDKVDIARLLVTELVSNAVQHGSGTVVLAAARERGGVRVEVYDESPDMPAVLESDSPMEHGAGLRLVAAMASRWGTASRGGHPGKRVWFVVG